MKKCLSIWFVFILGACSTPTPPATEPMLEATFTTVPRSTAPPSSKATPTLAPVPDGPCDNPLVPLATGNQWSYLSRTENGESMYTLNTLERSDDINIGVVVQFTDQARGTIVLERVVCQDGAIDNFPLFVMDMLLSDYLDKLFNTYHDGGVYVPAYGTIAENNWDMEWETEYLTENRVGIKNPVGGADLQVLESSRTRLSSNMDGSRQEVSVPAGNFPGAIKISQRVTLGVTIPPSTGGTLTLNTIQWYEPYVGLLRVQLESASANTGGGDFNVPYQSEVELVEFLPGQ